MGVRQACKISELKMDLQKERKEHETTRRQYRAISEANARSGSYITELRNKLRAAGFDDEPPSSDIRKKREIDLLRIRVEQLECPHRLTEVRVVPRKFINLVSDTFYTKNIAYRFCRMCGKELSSLSKAAHLSHLINDFIEKEVSDGNGVIRSIEKLRDASEKLRLAITLIDAAPDAKEVE